MFLCNFESLDDLKPKQRSDPEEVLNALTVTGRFSAFEHATTLATISKLEKSGRIACNPVGYPWTNVAILAEIES